MYNITALIISMYFIQYSLSHFLWYRFIPKFSPSTQEQYLYIPGIIPGDPEQLRTCRPPKFLVLIVTQLSKIPCSDCFRVVQYWSCEGSSSNTNQSSPIASVVRSGVTLHFTRSTIFRSQILCGTTEESSAAVKRWFAVADKIISSSTSSGSSGDVHDSPPLLTTLTPMETDLCEKIEGGAPLCNDGRDGLGIETAQPVIYSSRCYSGVIFFLVAIFVMQFLYIRFLLAEITKLKTNVGNHV